MSFKDEMEDRLINFALVGIEISENLPQSYIGEHLGKQLARSSTSPALNYAEACDAESRKDFIHKLKITNKELRETLVCLKIIHRKPLLINEKLNSAIKECNELISILSKSIQTTKLNQHIRES